MSWLLALLRQSEDFADGNNFRALGARVTGAVQGLAMGTELRLARIKCSNADVEDVY